MSWVSTLASLGMAVGPPLVYADQAYSIVKKKDATGFSRDVSAILLVSAHPFNKSRENVNSLIANITRCFFWLGDRFEMALLVQSIFMIIAQLALLYICILYRPRLSPENLGGSTRTFSFWQWPTYTQHIEFLAGLILLEAILFLILGHYDVYVAVLGFIALGLESTLPIPQLISNYSQRSLYGFRMSTLIGWAGGDAFKTAYFFLQGSPLQFKVCAIFQLSVDLAIVGQRFVYGNAPPATVVLDEEDLEQALALDEE
ncbi:Clathrin heavy chain [Mycena indigotica]|uniref:Clathrin heavy chain n=1 Tax=Mycena indigotica TaxID=2126181 RepID=A0A8H6T2B6_9AGAR|nr:Clathrin heavy chain [Mycena indigotica]KAF7309604.1 Clathrin heavy chain [Mycena indigotica]